MDPLRPWIKHPGDKEVWERVTLRCDKGHQQTFEQPKWAALYPVYCPQCSWQTPWYAVGTIEEWEQEIEFPE